MSAPNLMYVAFHTDLRPNEGKLEDIYPFPASDPAEARLPAEPPLCRAWPDKQVDRINPETAVEQAVLLLEPSGWSFCRLDQVHLPGAGMKYGRSRLPATSAAAIDDKPAPTTRTTAVSWDYAYKFTCRHSSELIRRPHKRVPRINGPHDELDITKRTDD
jgi:hypothetical protein